MATNIELDIALLAEAQKLGGHRTKKAAVDAALREYVRHRKGSSILELFGQVEFHPDYDYKSQRSR